MLQVFGPTVYVTAYDEYHYRSIDDATKQGRSLTFTWNDIRAKYEATGTSANTIPSTGNGFSILSTAIMLVTRYARVLHDSTNGQLKKMDKSIVKLRGP